MRYPSIAKAILLVLACPFLWAATTIYTWTDDDGTRYFSDQPPPDVEGVRRFGEPVDPAASDRRDPKTELFSARVVVVSEGDTLTVLRDGDIVEIRLHGVDSPEPGQAFADAARQFTATLCFDRTVDVRPLGQDPGGRMTAIVYLEDRRELNYELLKAGMAWHAKKFSDDDMYDAAVTHARELRLGIWIHPEPIPPWEYRKGAFRFRLKGN